MKDLAVEEEGREDSAITKKESNRIGLYTRFITILSDYCAKYNYFNNITKKSDRLAAFDINNGISF